MTRDKSKAARTPAGDRAVSALDLLAAKLARKDLSVAEARVLLADTGEVEEALARALDRKWLDDERLAARLLERALAKVPPLAPAAITEMLTARGLAAELVARLQARADEAPRRRLRRYVEAQRRLATPARLAGRLGRAGWEPEEVEEELVRTSDSE